MDGGLQAQQAAAVARLEARIRTLEKQVAGLPAMWPRRATAAGGARLLQVHRWVIGGGGTALANACAAGDVVRGHLVWDWSDTVTMQGPSGTFAGTRTFHGRLDFVLEILSDNRCQWTYLRHALLTGEGVTNGPNGRDQSSWSGSGIQAVPAPGTHALFTDTSYATFIGGAADYTLSLRTIWAGGVVTGLDVSTGFPVVGNLRLQAEHWRGARA